MVLMYLNRSPYVNEILDSYKKTISLFFGLFALPQKAL